MQFFVFAYKKNHGLCNRNQNRNLQMWPCGSKAVSRKLACAMLQWGAFEKCTGKSVRVNDEFYWRTKWKKCSNNKRTVRILCKLTTNDGIWFFPVAAWKKSFTVREREHRNESVPLSCCPIISDFTIAIGVGAYTIYSALKREKTVIIIIMMIMLHLNFFHAHLKNRHSFLLIALHCSEQRF